MVDSLKKIKIVKVTLIDHLKSPILPAKDKISLKVAFLINLLKCKETHTEVQFSDSSKCHSDIASAGRNSSPQKIDISDIRPIT